MNDNKNYYEILEIPVDATHEEISRAYQKAKNSYSGSSLALYSLLTESECKEILESIEEGYSILGQPSKRKEYDRIRGLTLAKKNTLTKDEFTFGEDLTTQESDMAYGLFAEEKVAPKVVATPVANAFSFKESEKVSTPASSDNFQFNRSDVFVSNLTAKHQFNLQYEVNPQFEKEIANSQDFNGEILQKIREYKNVSLEHLSDITKISKTHLRNIESENFKNLPAMVYTRGFIVLYAKYLKLPVDHVVNSYMIRFKSFKK
ncbi:MAG: helix-turn-helix domain-containing protein [Bacteriovoracaceae bacterium]|nr:helix-turn-helix domain-containing protein [Bacteriovoracaceae bacterium]